MAATPTTSKHLVERGEAIYRDRIQSLVEPRENGKYLTIDIDSGTYEIDQDEVVATKRAQQRHPNGTFVALRVGYPATYNLGGRFVPNRPC